eukprot:Trichotokara_eunicae@DN4810_c0_g1_i1.p1
MHKRQYPEETLNLETMPRTTLRTFQRKLDVPLSSMVEYCKGHLSPFPMTKQQIIDTIGEPIIKEIVKLVGDRTWEKNDIFEPLRRVVHCYEEAQRVDSFCSVAQDENIPAQERL